jgi:hypothetical protein
MSLRTMRFSRVLAAVLLCSTPLVPTATGAAAPEMCFGRVPTIVGVPGEELLGTPDQDVVSSNGARYVDTLAGDDLLCITGFYPEEDYNDDYHQGPVFSTRGGSDHIDVSQLQTDYDFLFVYVRPGRGPDEVIGGSNTREEVTAGSDDRVDLAGGIDSLWLKLKGAGGNVRGGPGDTLILQLPHADHRHWTADHRSGTISHDSVMAATFSGFTRFFGHIRGSFDFVGSDDREIFTLRVNRTWTPPVGGVDIDIDMNGGDDRVNFSGGAPGARFDGGEGDDHFDFSAGQLFRRTLVVFNMRSGVLRDTWPAGEVTSRRATSFETAVISNGQCCVAGRTIIKGNAASNSLKVWGPGPSELYGRGGDDELLGGSGNSLLVGGSGHDKAYGEGGEDHCEAEVVRHCEA